LPEDAEPLEALRAAAGHLSGARWSGRKDASELRLHEQFPFFERGGQRFFGAVFSFPPDSERYFAPFMLSSNGKAGFRSFEVGPGRFLAEAERSRGYASFTLKMMRRGGRLDGGRSRIAWTGKIRPGRLDSVRGMGGDTTNVVVGLRTGAGRMVLKSYRTLDHCNPEPELLGHLSAQRCTVTPRMLGSCLLEPKQGDAGATVLSVMLRHVEGQPGFEAFTGNAGRVISKGLPAHFCMPRRLGEAVAELHGCLFDPNAPASLRPELITGPDIERWSALVRSRYDEALGILDGPRREKLAGMKHSLEAAIKGMDAWKGIWKIRTHQDLHLGQVLVCRGGFKIIDFEGEPLRKGAQRREKLPPGRDLGTMLRSFSYAAAVALRRLGKTDTDSLARAAAWERLNCSAFLQGYVDARPPTLQSPEGLAEIVKVWAAEKALYEIAYEAKFRPDWVDIPLKGLFRLLGKGLET
jgi:trehalose synthase-fused probable maltokinase